MVQHLKEGTGWRLGWQSETISFQGLVGNNHWAFELTAAEFNDFRRLFQELAASMQSLRQELMAEERLVCEARSELISMQIEGVPDAYGLRLMLLTGRRSEGVWDAPSTSEILQALQTLEVF
ncbi:MAG: DUF1818 family protein [Acaryochloridaceae cyanobacterium SU_2_1]|nr:DUF1818 family protein [Acaryochloridaceae cyanobacterium SU_2_1]